MVGFGFLFSNTFDLLEGGSGFSCLNSGIFSAGVGSGSFGASSGLYKRFCGVDDLAFRDFRLRHRNSRAADQIHFYVFAASARASPLVAFPVKVGRERKQNDEPAMKHAGDSKKFPEAEIIGFVDIRIGDCRRHKLLRAITVRNRFGDDTDVIDAGLAERVYHRRKNAERNLFVAAKVNRVLLFAEFGLHDLTELVDVDRIVAQIDCSAACRA